MSTGEGRYDSEEIGCSSEAYVYAMCTCYLCVRLSPLTGSPTAEWAYKDASKPKITVPLVVKMSDDDYDQEEIRALKLRGLWVANGKDSRSDNWAIVMHRGKGSPIENHPDVKDPAKKRKALEHFLPSAVKVIKRAAEQGWMQA